MIRTINISDFSTYPHGVSSDDGDFNGSTFRENILFPEIKKAIVSGGMVKVNLDNVVSYSASFLQEAFQGLIRVNGLSRQQLAQHLIVEAKEPRYRRYAEAVYRYIT